MKLERATCFATRQTLFGKRDNIASKNFPPNFTLRHQIFLLKTRKH